jgi:hypothetical protein
MTLNHKLEMMSLAIKRLLFRAYDFIFSPLTLIASIHMRILRRYGISNFPIAHGLFLKVGVFPILRHFYEPLFHPGDVTQPLDACRNLPGIHFDSQEQLTLLKALNYNEEIVKCFGSEGPVTVGEYQFTINNSAFRQGDIELYYSIVRHFKPSRIIEIGSGYSTMVALLAVQKNESEAQDYRCEVMAVEPYPWFRHEKLKLFPQRVEDIDLALFKQLQKGDILFIDSSHMIRPQGDVLFEILQILPSLAPGVIVHFHDVFTPRDYLEKWVKLDHKFWNEQYLLDAFLTCNDRFKILLAPNYLQVNHPNELLACCPLLAKAPETIAGSFWIQSCLPGLSNV